MNSDHYARIIGGVIMMAMALAAALFLLSGGM